MKKIIINATTNAIEFIETEELKKNDFVKNTIEPTPEERIADMEAEIARLKSELNVQ